MVDFNLEMRPALAGAAANVIHGRIRETSGVVLSELWPLSVLDVLAFNGKLGYIETRLKNAFGLNVFSSPKRSFVQRSDSTSLALVWAGPAKWLAVAEGISDLDHQFCSVLGDTAMVVDQSHNYCLLRISGQKARAMLAKGLPVDIDAPNFDVDNVAMTQIDNIGVHIWQLDKSPSFEIAVQRSFAVSLLEWLITASAEFGCELSLIKPIDSNS